MTRTPHVKVPTPKTVRGEAGGKRFVSPIIPLERPSQQNPRKDQYLTFKLRSVPADEASTTYDLTILYFAGGSPEELLLFLQSLNQIYNGQNVTNGPGKCAIIRRFLQGDSLSSFN